MHQYLSIDIGGTEIKSALIDHSGRIIRKDSRPTPRTQGDFLAVIDQLAAATFGNEANLLGALYGHLLRLDGEE